MNNRLPFSFKPYPETMVGCLASNHRRPEPCLNKFFQFNQSDFR
jgi:hypothetical protein